MTAKNEEYAKVYADLNWCIDILERIEESIKRDSIGIREIKSIEWLVKQGLKVKREE